MAADHGAHDQHGQPHADRLRSGLDRRRHQPARPHPGLQAQLGFGPAGSNPASDVGWSWVDAVFNVDVGNNDEFMASLLPDAVGSYDYVYRYSTNGGRTWLYADLNVRFQPARRLPTQAD